MSIKKITMCMACLVTTAMTLSAQASESTSSDRSLSVGLGAISAPRYSGAKDQHTFFAPVIHAQDGNFFADTVKGLGYRFQSDNGLYLENTLGMDFGRSDKNSDWREGSDKLKGMGTIKSTLNTGVTAGWALSSWLVLEGKATMPLTDSQGNRYRTTVTLIPFQDESDVVTFQGSTLFGDARYMNTYYGVSEKQSAHSGYARYNAAGGYYGYDLGMTWSHQFTPHWGAWASVDYTRLDKHASDSPIVKKNGGTYGTLAVTYLF
ncbi:MipA/OmpV family protein [Candidatus Pantoea deserta]|uniref:MipA/OmpV family protein n=1 Tax=Candidatus Pantoea deserta TaxID=1869313 RepID=A0A3N4NHR4_9GAMM|nr:MipA/OmpV family protein [Pantoea deserta]RPD95904.1 MipA/OmpV family protein [Pantoea deserta]